MAKKLVTTALAAALSVCDAPAAKAWKPVTHVVLAHEVIEDAQDGSVTIYEVDPQTQRIVGTLGEFEVDKDVLKAILEYREKFYAGVIGPDAYPDILSGQQRIHPPGKDCDRHGKDPDDNCYGAGSDAWLDHVWRAARASQRPALVAFAAGMLAHGAGDIVAHTYVNTYTGGIFNIRSENAIKHVALEGYLGERTPTSTLPPSVFAAVDLAGIAGGVDEFIAAELVDVAPKNPREDGKNFSTHWQLSELRRSLRDTIGAYRREAARLQNEQARAWRDFQYWHAVATCTDPAGTLAAALLPIGIDCDTLTYPPGASRVADPKTHLEARGRMTAYLLESRFWRHAGELHGLAEPFVRHGEWFVLPALDKAMVEWVRTSHKVAIDVFFNPAGKSDFGSATSRIKEFADTLVMRCLGVPDPVISALQAFKDFKGALSAMVGAIKSDIVDELLFKPGLNYSRAQLKTIFTESHVYFDAVFANQATNGLPPLNRAIIDGQMGVGFPAPGDNAGWADRARVETFNVRPEAARPVFPPAFNTVTMIKLQLLSDKGMNALLRKVDARTPQGQEIAVVADDNAMVGHVATLDGSFQWALGPKLALARDCKAFRRVFFDAAPRVGNAPIGGAGAPANPCDTHGRPDPVLRPAGARLVGGGEVRIDAQEKVAFKLVEPAYGTLRAASDGLSAVFTAPAPVADVQQIVRAVAGDGSGRAGTWTVDLLAPLMIAASAEPGAPVDDPDLRQGQRRRFVVAPDLPVRWRVVAGPGAFADDARRATLAAEQAKYFADLTKKMANVEFARGELRRCVGACTAKRDKLAAARATVDAFIAAHEARQRELGRELATIDSTYYAPAQVSAPQQVTVEATAQDGSGRTARHTFTLRGAPPLQLDPAQARKVAAGGTFTPRITADVPVEWTVVSGPQGGRFGAELDSPIAAPLKQKAQAFESKLAARDQPPKLPSKLPQKPGVAKLPLPGRPQAPASLTGADADTLAALAELARMKSTYQAPAVVAAPSVVKLEGRALDGSGRTITVELTVTPKE